MPTDSLISRLGLRYPIIQGPFGGGYSSTRLLAAVSNAGGLGSFGAHMQSPAEIRETAREAKELAPGKPFNLNLWVNDDSGETNVVTQAEFETQRTHFQALYAEAGIEPPTYPKPPGYGFEQQVEAVIASRPAVLSLVFGIPQPAILAECRAQGILVIGAATTLDEGLALEEAGFDAVIASGFEAGGHRPSFLRPAEDSLTGALALTRQLVSRLRLPVITAGGIADGAGVAAVLRAGAVAAQIGTAFLACEESGAPPLQRKLLFTERARYTRLTRHISGRFARFLENRLVREVEAMPRAPLAYPAQGWLTAPLKRAANTEDPHDLGVFYSGQGAPLIRHQRAVELLAALVEEAGLT